MEGVRWTKQQLIDYENRRFRDAQNRGSASGAKPQQPVRDVPLAENKGEARNKGRFQVSIVSFRRRLMDPDNLCGKYFLDQCRYDGHIPDDTAAVIGYSISQTKVFRKQDERTEIEITPL